MPLFLDFAGLLGCHLASPHPGSPPPSNWTTLSPSPAAYTVAYKSPILSLSHKHTHTHTHTQGYFPLSQSSLYRPFIVPFSAPMPPGFPPRPPGWNEYPCFVHLLSPLTLNEAPSSYSATVTSQPLILPPQSPVHPSWEDITPPLPFDLSVKTVNDFPPPAG